MEALLVGRFVQAFGACAGMVLARAIVRDVNSRDTAASALAYVTMGMSLMPMVAPSIGGLLDEHFGWQASFVVILVFVAGVAGAASLRCPETNHHRLAAVDVGHLVRGWTSLARSPAYLGYTLAMTFNTVSFFSFLVAAPYLTISVLNRPPSEYGFWFVGCALGYLLGNFIAGRWSQRLGLDRMARIGNWLTFPGMVFWFAWANLQEIQIWALFIPMFVNAFANGLAQPNLIAGAVSVNPRLAGSASGLLGCVQMSFGALATVLMGHIQDDTMRPLAFMMLLCCLASMACHAIAVRAMRSLEPQAG